MPTFVRSSTAESTCRSAKYASNATASSAGGFAFNNSCTSSTLLAGPEGVDSPTALTSGAATAGAARWAWTSGDVARGTSLAAAGDTAAPAGGTSLAAVGDTAATAGGASEAATAVPASSPTLVPIAVAAAPLLSTAPPPSLSSESTTARRNRRRLGSLAASMPATPAGTGAAGAAVCAAWLLASLSSGASPAAAGAGTTLGAALGAASRGVGKGSVCQSSALRSLKRLLPAVVMLTTVPASRWATCTSKKRSSFSIICWPTPVNFTGSVVAREPRRRKRSSCCGVRVESNHFSKSFIACATFFACDSDHSLVDIRSSASSAPLSSLSSSSSDLQSFPRLRGAEKKSSWGNCRSRAL
mmetsp:Transcript_49157/g.111981  ORF Transcript_49157/g.111981 Transcript_49157/m.111981 type:complete len:357 (+) Transcript_49157:191-1261(+)